MDVETGLDVLHIHAYQDYACGGQDSSAPLRFLSNQANSASGRGHNLHNSLLIVHWFVARKTPTQSRIITTTVHMLSCHYCQCVQQYCFSDCGCPMHVMMLWPHSASHLMKVNEDWLQCPHVLWSTISIFKLAFYSAIYFPHPPNFGFFGLMREPGYDLRDTYLAWD